MSLDLTQLPAGEIAFRAQRLAVFGFALRDDFRLESGLDLLVKFEPGARTGFRFFFEMQDELSRIT